MGCKDPPGTVRQIQSERNPFPCKLYNIEQLTFDLTELGEVKFRAVVMVMVRAETSPDKIHFVQ